MTRGFMLDHPASLDGGPLAVGAAGVAALAANVAAILFIGSFIAFQFVAVLYLQELRGWSALETGVALLPVGIDAILAAPPRAGSRDGKRT